MNVEGKVVAITGAASGIGKALAERFHREGAQALILADLNDEGVRAVAPDVSPNLGGPVTCSPRSPGMLRPEQRFN